MADARIDPDAFNAFEAAAWEERDAGYDAFAGRVTAHLVEPLLDAVAAGPGVRLLDVATGPGYAAARAAERGAEVIGVDIAAAMVAAASRLHPRLDFRRADAEALPFADASFDAVVANFMLLHLGRPERGAAEFARVLAPGGRVALTVWDRPERMRLIGVFLDAAAEAGAQPPAELPAGPSFFRFSDDAELAQLLRDQRLEDVRVRTVAFRQRARSADELWHGILAGTVRTTVLIRAQSEDVQRRIRTAFDRLVQPYATGDGLEVSVSAKLASATRAASG